MNEFKGYSVVLAELHYLRIEDQPSDGFNCNSKVYTAGVNSPKMS